MNQQEADNLANMQSQVVQMGSQVQQLNMMANNIAVSRVTLQNNFRLIQQNLNAINQEVSRQLAQKIR
jgi:hypothetical protein